MRFVRVLLTSPGPAAEHLLEQDARSHRSEEDEELKIWNVHAGREQVHRDHDRRVRAIPEFTDALKRTIYAARHLGYEGITPGEHVAAEINELIRV